MLIFSLIRQPWMEMGEEILPPSLCLTPFLENCQRHRVQNKSTSVSDHFPSIPILTTLYIYPGLQCNVGKIGFMLQFVWPKNFVND